MCEMSFWCLLCTLKCQMVTQYALNFSNCWGNNWMLSWQLGSLDEKSKNWINSIFADSVILTKIATGFPFARSATYPDDHIYLVVDVSQGNYILSSHCRNEKGFMDQHMLVSIRFHLIALKADVNQCREQFQLTQWRFSLIEQSFHWIQQIWQITGAWTGVNLKDSVCYLSFFVAVW